MGFKSAKQETGPIPRPENEVKVELVEKDEVVPIPKAKSIYQAMGWIIRDDIRQYILGKPRIHPYIEDYEKAAAMKKFENIVKKGNR